jgi:hypothetical protein
MLTTTWPDGPTFQACAQNPGKHFLDPELAQATFEPDRRRGGVQAWSGGRATVIRANRSSGDSIAVRFSKQEDQQAAVRYYELSRYLSSNPVSTMVRTSWAAQGLRIGEGQYPILKMDWVSGKSLDTYITRRLESGGTAAEIATLAKAWRESCRSLGAANISHGDVHAGNTLVRENAQRPVELRLVDYDNVWFPGLHTPRKEIGHPAFQHPRRSEVPVGPNLDAVPNTLTYLSLTALASDPNLWRFHTSDDRLLFEKSDLADPSTAVWSALLNNSDAEVAALAKVTLDWLLGPPNRFSSLEHVLAQASSAPLGPPSGPVNVWPPRNPAHQRPNPATATSWPPSPTRPGAPPPPPPTWSATRSNGVPHPAQVPQQQSWQGLKQPPQTPDIHPIQRPGAASPPPRSPVQQTSEKADHGSRAALIIIAVILAIIVIGLLAN